MIEDYFQFQKRMCETYPLLYNYKNNSEEYFGFDIGPGWFPIIEDLSQKLETLIKPIYEEVLTNPKTRCIYCDKTRRWHWFYTIIGFFLSFFRNRKKSFKAFYFYLQRRKKYSKKFKEEQSILKVLYYYLFKYQWYRTCAGWTPDYPFVVQVKQKFGGLRFYMNFETKEMSAAIYEAEKRAQETCEDCGKPGVLRSGGWLETLCDNCAGKGKL